MLIHSSLDEIKTLTKPTILTIGNFDGVHIGHQAILNHLTLRAKEKNEEAIVLTFSNHPASILRPNSTPKALCTPEHKLKLIQKAGVDRLILLPFTSILSEKSPEKFLEDLRRNLPFTHLILGHDGSFGHNREGNIQSLPDLADQFGFTFEYLPKQTIHGETVSSSLIRKRVSEGGLDQAKEMLGRPFSIYASPIKGHGLGKTIGFSTLNFPVEGLTLPPYGVYAVEVESHPAVANLGLAPTVRNDQEPHLEVHLLEEIQIPEKPILVSFKKKIRDEKKFDTINALKEQIQKDIESVKY
jgi:riboflavin kinase/FMN adenylyltransferase